MIEKKDLKEEFEILIDAFVNSDSKNTSTLIDSLFNRMKKLKNINNTDSSLINVYFKAKRIDNGEWITGFFTKKEIGSLIVPVIEVYKEWDTGDYMKSYEIDGNTIISAT